MRTPMMYDRRWIREARLKAGLTQEEIAKYSGITTAQYNRIELGYCKPSITAGLKMCDKLSLNPRNFLTEKVQAFVFND